MLALQRFPGVPAVFFSHDFTAWHDAAPHFPRILRYVAVDQANADRLVLTHDVPPDRIRVVLNAVDCERFRPRSPLPATPSRALVFSNYASERTHARAVREACERVSLALDFVGEGTGTHHERPEEVLGRYDLVFAKGRCALEAMAAGAAVVLVDFSGAGPMVTRDAVERLRRDNFGRRLLQSPLDPSSIAAEIRRYRADDAAAVSAWIRENANLERQLDELIGLYQEVVEERARMQIDPMAEARAAAAYYRQWGPRVREGDLRNECDRRWLEIARVSAERDELQGALERSRGDVERLANERGQIRNELERARADSARAEGIQHDLRLEIDRVRARGEEALRAEVARVVATERHARDEATRLMVDERDRLAAELAQVTGAATWRLRERLLRWTWLVAVYRSVRGLGPEEQPIPPAAARKRS
jgi:hypothetical protein